MSTAATTLEVDQSQNLVVVRYHGRVGAKDTASLDEATNILANDR